ncbi:MAG TPA: diguanylate cyclase, partial [Candidatus Brocadiia bacterium]|nr:diguanylate cyclase [Candidatus Brocadiia bacterium]
MPGMDGPAICRRLRDRANAPFIYTILLTSRRDEEGLVNALDNGAHGFLVKPVAAEELRSHVNVGLRLVESEDQLKRYANEMERLATTDPLTGASNRRHFFDHAQRELVRSHRYHHPFCVLILDLDHFKRINDTCGHAVGDDVLRGAAKACRDTLRKNDLFARIGGEEFVALLPETGEASGVEAAERLRAAIRAIPAPALTGPITASVGVAAYSGKGETIDILLRRADEALYKAKAQGRDRVATWSP